MVETVLCYIEKDNSYLMLYKNKRKNDYNLGKWVGIGGHVEKNETIEECLLREVYEETGLKLLNYKNRGIVYFYNDEYKEKMYLFTSNSFSGNLIDCDEGELKYVLKKNIYDLPMWEGDKCFLNKILNNEDYFEMILYYKNNRFEGCEEL